MQPKGKGKRKVRNRKYTSAAELAERNSSAAPTAMKIIDMTGATTRVVDSMTSSTEAGAARKPLFLGVDGSVPMAELQHNVNILIQLAETDVIKMTNLLRQDEQQRALLKEERTDLAQSLATETRHLTAVDALVASLARLETSPPLDTAACLELFGDIHRAHPQAYVTYDVAGMAKMAAETRLRKMLQGWNPFQEPTLGQAELEGWRELLLYRPKKHYVSLPAEKDVSG
jgi:hypothetical protein